MQAMLAWAMGTALLGIDVGWQPIAEGGLEYIVQIDPETLARLKPGDELATGIRPVLRDVRRYRIVIGKGPLPRVALPEGPTSSPGGSIQPRSAPAPLAAAESQRSILVPAERAAESRPAPLAAAPSVAPGPRVAAVPRVAPSPTSPPANPAFTQPAARVTPAFEALEEAPAKATVKAPAALPERTWQAPATLTAPPPVAAPKAKEKSAPLIPPPSVNETKNQPPIDVGDRYRNVPLNPPSSPPPTTDRYRDFTPPPAAASSKLILPPPPVDKSERAFDKSAKIEDGFNVKSKTVAEVAGPPLPPPSNDQPSMKMKVATKPPAFEFKEPAPLGESRLMADTLAQKPAPLLSDPAVRPASAEPSPAPPAAAVIPAAAPAATSAPAEPPPRPWLALTLALFALFASLGGNVFLGWIAHDARSRYGLLLRENHSLPTS